MVETTESGLLKSLHKLESLLGGDEDVDKSQITTGPGSSDGQLGVMKKEEYTDKWADGIGGDGSEYNGRGKRARKAAGEMPEGMGDEEPEDDDDDDDDDEKERRNRRAESDDDEDKKKSLPTPGLPLRTKKPSDSGEKIEPGAPGMTKSDPPGMSNPYGTRSAGYTNVKREGDPVERRPATPAATPARSGSTPAPAPPKYSPNVRRSFEIEEDGELRRGIEVSEFIFYLKKSMEDAFYDLGQRVSSRINHHFTSRGDYAKSMAEAVVGINKSLFANESEVAFEEESPAHAAKSVMGGQAQEGSSLQKSLARTQDLRKAVQGELQEIFEKGGGEVNAIDIIKFESTGQLRPEVSTLLKSIS